MMHKERAAYQVERLWRKRQIEGIADQRRGDRRQMGGAAVEQRGIQAYALSPQPASQRQRNVAGAAGDVQQLDLAQRKLVDDAAHQALAGLDSPEPAIYPANVGESGSDLLRCSAIAVQQLGLDLAFHATLDENAPGHDCRPSAQGSSTIQVRSGREQIMDEDVFIAGGGPAGLAAAIAARLAGFSVLLADCGLPSIDKACGEGIMPEGVAALAQLGISFSSGQTFAFRGIKFIECGGGGAASGGCVAEAHFPSGSGWGIRRTVLHQRLLERACQLGVKMLWRARAVRITAEGAWVDGELVRSRWLVCADGQNSRLREQAGFCPARRQGSSAGSLRRFGFRRHYRMTPWSDFVEVYWSDCGQLYVTPVADNQIAIALLTRHPGLRLEDALPRFASVSHRLRGATPSSRELGGLTVTRRLPLVQRGNAALIGDASGSVDAITGEGLSMAFQQALELAQAMTSGDLNIYQRAHRLILRRPYVMAELMLAMDRHHGLRRRVFRTFEADPSLFRRLVNIHIGARPPRSLGVSGVLSLAWRLFAA